ncbi:MAG: DUF3489 domain-containing protein [Bauldia sp.]|nr:DUF3489 domain-containing protein [Bauldia sp.]
MTKLSDSQLVILGAACERADGCVFPITSKLKGNAAGNVLKSLLNKGLIKEVRAKRDDTVWRHDERHGRMTLQATRAGFEALGIDPREAGSGEEGSEDTNRGADASETAADAGTNARPGRRPKRGAKTKTPARIKSGASRGDSKQAQLIAMLKQRNGATIDEIVKAFGWQPHTVRGAIAGALKKKLGLEVTSEKVESRGRVYRITG